MVVVEEPAEPDAEVVGEFVAEPPLRVVVVFRLPAAPVVDIATVVVATFEGIVEVPPALLVVGPLVAVAAELVAAALVAGLLVAELLVAELLVVGPLEVVGAALEVVSSERIRASA